MVLDDQDVVIGKGFPHRIDVELVRSFRTCHPPAKSGGIQDNFLVLRRWNQRTKRSASILDIFVIEEHVRAAHTNGLHDARVILKNHGLLVSPGNLGTAHGH